jgi:hypothetical protein
MARRSKYTPQLVNELIQAIELGMTDGDACLVAGLSESQFYHWLKTKPEFADRVTCARAKGWLSDLAIIKRAAVQDRDWRAAAEHLDRTRSPYRKSQDLTVTHGGSITHDHRDLSMLDDRELDQLAALAAKIERGEVSG